VYTIARGDNLWKIASRVLGDAFLWRKIWEENPQLSNPHDLKVGDKLIYYKSDRNLASDPDVIIIPKIKLLPYAKGATTDLDQGSVVNINIQDRFRPRIFVLSPDEKILGQLKGAYLEGEAMNFHELVYIAPEESHLKPGEKFAIIHLEKALRDRSQPGAPILGTMARMVGEVEIQEMGDKLAKGQVTSIFSVIKRGDKIIPLSKVGISADKVDPPKELQCQIVIGEDEDVKWFGQGQIVLVNKGKEEGMKEGFIFRVWRERDKFSDLSGDVEPESKGEAQIVHVNNNSSLAYILKNKEPLLVGDNLVPRQVFSNPPPAPRRESQVLKID
jgi:hypothetical protein